MRYLSAVLFAALMVWESTSPVFACRGANNATIVKAVDPFVNAGVDQYNIKVDPNQIVPFAMVIGPNYDSGFCVELSILDSSDLQNTATGVMFWSASNDLNSAYFVLIRNDQYQISRQLFGKVYVLIPWTTNASIKKGLRQKNEVDVRVAATGADIQINGTAINNIVARPSVDAENYGVVFWTPKTGTGQFQIGSPRIVK
jgi:hypothetical protein